jgi:NAD(P)-dependent dehydrogenase (short-subunit alcohol dehydrogenase family)
VAVVTGGAGGIGQAIIRFMCETGATTVGLDRDIATAQRFVNEMQTGGASVEMIDVDLVHENEIRSAVELILDRHGRIDIWCNNAGLGSSSGMIKGVVDTTADEWLQLLSTNLTSVGLCCRHVLPVMAAAGSGAIVNTSSGSAIVGTGHADAYSASKAGVLGLTRSLAADWASSGIRINCVCPGCVDTPMYAAASDDTRMHDIARTPIGRIASAEEIAAVIWFLATDAASYMTGAVVCVDGGWTSA